MESLFAYNLEFFNLLAKYNQLSPTDIRIESVDELFDLFRNELFKCIEYQYIYKGLLKQIHMDRPSRKRLLYRVFSSKRSTSCPQLWDKINCITTGNVHRCLFTSIQANVTQAFKLMDFDFDNKLTYTEFRKGIIEILFNKRTFSNNLYQSISYDDSISYSNTLDRYSIKEKLIMDLFSKFDYNQDGIVEFGEFIREIRAPICPKRLKLIYNVFTKLDANKDGYIKIDDLKYWYTNSAKFHPKYLKGEWTTDQVLRASLKYYELPGENTGIITLEKFVAYYSVLSATIMNDAYFDLLIRSTFDL